MTLPYLLAAFFLRFASAPTAAASFAMIALYAMLGRAQAIQAFAISWLFSMLNPALAPTTSFAATGRYLIIIGAALSMVLRSSTLNGGGHVKKFNVATLLFSAFLLIHSALFSTVVDVSILKAASWAIVVLTLLAAWDGLSSEKRTTVFRNIEVGLIALTLLSVPLLVIPSIGFAVNGTGFQGILIHPQAFGPAVALTGALTGGRIMKSFKPKRRDLVLLLLCFVLVIFSEARTAGLAMIVGLAISAFISPRLAGLPSKEMLPGLRSTRVRSALILAVLLVATLWPLFAGKITEYAFKRSDASTLLAAADASRGGLIEAMTSNIALHPFAGIGFGIASNLEDMVVQRDPVTGLPLSAQVEKGVMPVAALEELGIFGATLLIFWIYLLLRFGARSGVSEFAVLVTLLLVNLGESMLFSVGGMGMLLLVLTAAAVTGRSKAGRLSYRG
jgi:hypothetical protein